MPIQHLARLNAQYLWYQQYSWMQACSSSSKHAKWFANLRYSLRWLLQACLWIDISDTSDIYCDALSKLCGHGMNVHWRTRSSTGIPATLFVTFHKKRMLSMINLRCTQIPLFICIMARPYRSTLRDMIGEYKTRRKGGMNGTLNGVPQLDWSQTEPYWSRADW